MATASRVVSIPKLLLSDQQVASLKESLTFCDNREPEFAQPPLIAFEETTHAIKIPRIFGIGFCNDNGISFVDLISDGDDIQTQFKGTLRDIQEPAVASAIEALSAQPHGATLSLYCGAGKTTCSLYISSIIAKKTLILVHTSALAAQWKDRIEQFVEGASVGSIRGEVCDIEHRTHCVALMQTIYRRTGERSLPEELLNSFGLLIVDEAHHVPAQRLSTCIALVGCKRRLGLSATLERKDGATRFTFCALGPVCHELRRDGDGTTRVYAIRTGTEVEMNFVRRAGKSTPNISRSINDLCDNSARTDLIISWIVKCARVGRKIIVLSDRRSHLERMDESLSAKGIQAVQMVGGVSDADRLIAETAPVLLATYAFASEGLDIAALDTCILVSPRRDVVQCVGRILRIHANKKSPLVIDLVDEKVGVFQNQFRARSRYYKSPRLAATVTYYNGMKKVAPVQKTASKPVQNSNAFMFDMSVVQQPKKAKTSSLQDWINNNK